MNPKKQLRQLARNFALKYRPQNYGYLVCTRREIIIRNFLADCPDPIYVEHAKKADKTVALVNFVNSTDFEQELRKAHGCVIHLAELRRELTYIHRINDPKLRREVQTLYSRIQKKMGTTKRLSLISNASHSDQEMKNEVVLHESIHELLEDNGLRLNSWKWNEGLVTYLTYFALGKHKRFHKTPKLTGKRMWDIYARFAHRWALLFRDITNPVKRKRLITKKVQETKKKKRQDRRS